MIVSFHYELGDELMNEIRDPYYVDFSVTPYCNLKCSFCSASACGKYSKTYEISFDEVKDIFNQFDENNIMRVSIEGGEPFLRSDILDILELVNNHMFSCYINTNGTLITEEIAKRISTSGVEKICISIDGPEEVHDRSRGIKGTFKKVKEAVGYLQKYDVPIDAIITLTKINAKYMIETFDVIKNMGINNVAIMLLATVGEASKNHVSIDYSEWKEVLINLTDLKKENKLSVNLQIVHTGESQLPWELYLPLMEAGREEDLSMWIPPNITSSLEESDFGCTAGRDNLAIDGFGNVFGCSLMISSMELSAGNVLKDKLSNIWRNSEIFQMMRSSKLDNIEGKCKDCKLLYKCKGGCRACAYAKSLNYKFSDERCPVCRGERIWS